MAVENTEANREKCACPACPSFDSCMSEAREALYCAAGTSACELEKLGCICASCVVHRQNALTAMYYCVIGAA